MNENKFNKEFNVKGLEMWVTFDKEDDDIYLMDFNTDEGGEGINTHIMVNGGRMFMGFVARLYSTPEYDADGQMYNFISYSDIRDAFNDLFEDFFFDHVHLITPLTSNV
jgi:hypothetical protein